MVDSKRAVDYQPGVPAGVTQTSVAGCIINVSYDGSAHVEYKGIALPGTTDAPVPALVQILPLK